MSTTALAFLKAIARRTAVLAEGRTIAPEYRQPMPVSDFYRAADLHSRGLAL